MALGRDFYKGVPFPTLTSGVLNGYQIKLDDLASPDDNTDLDVSLGAHGLIPKLSAAESQFLNGTGVWSTPDKAIRSVVLAPGSGSVSVEYSTIGAAIAVAVSGDVILVGPGAYAESGLVIPGGVTMIAPYGPLKTSITGAAATGTRVTLGEACSIKGFRVMAPTDATSAISLPMNTLGSVYDCQIMGTGGVGRGVTMSGSGNVLVRGLIYVGGDTGTVLRLESGTLFVTDCLVCIFGGAIDYGIEALGGTLNGQTIIIEPSGVLQGLHVGNAHVRCTGLNIYNAATAVYVDHKDAAVHLNAFRAEDITNNVIFITDGLASSPTMSVMGDFSREQLTYAAEYDDITLSYLDITKGDQAFVVDGEIIAGRAEHGHEAVFGEGDSYVRGMKVLTTDGTADASTDGGNLTDVSAEAASSSGSTFGFQDKTAGHAILIGSTLSGTLDVLKHFGIKSKTDIAASDTSVKSFQFEIWDGSVWSRIETMATHSSLFYSYADNLFLRGSCSEHIRYGVSAATTWAKKTIDGSELFWSRVRITTTLATAPTFEQFKLSPNRTEINGEGTITHHGDARYRSTVAALGNIFGETGNVANANYTVGSGTVPLGWTHNSPNSVLNSDGDAIYMQFLLPKGICTSQPILADIAYTITSNPSASSTVSLIASLQVTDKVGNLIADPTGGIAPIAREQGISNTLTTTSGGAARPAQTVTVAATSDSAGYVYNARFSPFLISGYYEGDAVHFRLELDDDGAQTSDVTIIGLEISGVNWTSGARLLS